MDLWPPKVRALILEFYFNFFFLSSNFCLLLLTDKFKKREYSTPDMANVLKATSTVGVKALKPSFRWVKDQGNKLECLSKSQTEWDTNEVPSKDV